jgi:hypothetical protein
MAERDRCHGVGATIFAAKAPSRLWAAKAPSRLWHFSALPNIRLESAMRAKADHCSACSHLAMYRCPAYIPDMSRQDSKRANHRRRQDNPYRSSQTKSARCAAQGDSVVSDITDAQDQSRGVSIAHTAPVDAIDAHFSRTRTAKRTRREDFTRVVSFNATAGAGAASMRAVCPGLRGARRAND